MSAGRRVLMLLENNPYRRDIRVKREATSLASAGYKVTVIAPKVDRADAGRDVIDGVTVYRFTQPANTGGLAGYLLEYGWSTFVMATISLRVWMREGFDVIHSHNPPDTMFVIAWFYKLFGKKYVFDHHDVAPEMYDARYGADAKSTVRRVLAWLEQMTFRTADFVIATNESHRALATGRGKIPVGRTEIVRNGPDTGSMYPTEEDPELRARAGTILAYVGVMGPQDGVDYLLRAVHHLIHDVGRDDVYAVIIGRGDAVDDLKGEAERLGISDKVWFTGWISYDDLLRYLTTADLGIDPDPSNPFNDKCTMIKMMEFMAMGLPIVAFDLPEHRISAEDAAVYATPNDELDMAHKIDELMNDPDRRSRMSEIGRRRIDDVLSWKYQEERLLGAYDRIFTTAG